MLASSQGEQSDEIPEPLDGAFKSDEVGSPGYARRHSTQMFEEGRSFSGNERDKVFLNRGDGTFFDVSDLSGADSPNDGRAVIACDFDDDGDVDVFVHELQRERHALYRNELGNRYGGVLKLRLRATALHPEAIGATVRVTSAAGTTAQTLSRGAGYLSCQAPELVFGLGPDADEATVRVRWPGGGLDEYTLPANGRYELVEGGAAEPFEARRVTLPDPLPAGLTKQVGELVGPLAVIDPDGSEAILDPVALADGKPLYLNFWASYCGPCVAELPLLKRMHEAGEVRVVALSMDAPGDMAGAQEVLEERAEGLPSFYLGAQARADGSAAAVEELIDLQRLPIPTTLVLDAEGRITEIVRGPLREE